MEHNYLSLIESRKKFKWKEILKIIIKINISIFRNEMKIKLILL